MKKNRIEVNKIQKNVFILTAFIVLIILVLVISNSEYKLKNNSIQDNIEYYYSENAPENNGELKIGKIKDFKDGYLVLAEKYSGEGERYSDLFLLNKNNDIMAKTIGAISISPGFSVNITQYNNTNIIFGVINDSKMIDVNKVGRDNISVSNIKIEFDNGITLSEKEIINNSYIITSDRNSIKEILLYNENNELQDKLSNYKDSNFIKYCIFEEI